MEPELRHPQGADDRVHEDESDLRRRIDEAARVLPLEQLALSPQCGFGSDVSGNLIGEEDQKRKLELVAKVARKVWQQ